MRQLFFVLLVVCACAALDTPTLVRKTDILASNDKTALFYDDPDIKNPYILAFVGKTYANLPYGNLIPDSAFRNPNDLTEGFDYNQIATYQTYMTKTLPYTIGLPAVLLVICLLGIIVFPFIGCCCKCCKCCCFKRNDVKQSRLKKFIPLALIFAFFVVAVVFMIFGAMSPTIWPKIIDDMVGNARKPVSFVSEKVDGAANLIDTSVDAFKNSTTDLVAALNVTQFVEEIVQPFSTPLSQLQNNINQISLKAKSIVIPTVGSGAPDIDAIVSAFLTPANDSLVMATDLLNDAPNQAASTFNLSKNIDSFVSTFTDIANSTKTSTIDQSTSFIKQANDQIDNIDKLKKQMFDPFKSGVFGISGVYLICVLLPCFLVALSLWTKKQMCVMCGTWLAFLFLTVALLLSVVFGIFSPIMFEACGLMTDGRIMNIVQNKTGNIGGYSIHPTAYTSGCRANQNFLDLAAADFDFSLNLTSIFNVTKEIDPYAADINSAIKLDQITNMRANISDNLQFDPAVEFAKIDLGALGLSGITNTSTIQDIYDLSITDTASVLTAQSNCGASCQSPTFPVPVTCANVGTISGAPSTNGFDTAVATLNASCTAYQQLSAFNQTLYEIKELVDNSTAQATAIFNAVDNLNVTVMNKIHQFANKAVDILNVRWNPLLDQARAIAGCKPLTTDLDGYYSLICNQFVPSMGTMAISGSMVALFVILILFTTCCFAVPWLSAGTIKSNQTMDGAIEMGTVKTEKIKSKKQKN